MRAKFLYQRYRRRKVLAIYAPVFRAIRHDEPYQLESIARSDMRTLLELWIEQRLHADSEFATRLEQFAYTVGLDNTVERVLQPGSMYLLPPNVWLQDLALEAAQWLNTRSVRKFVYLVAQSDDLYLAIRACVCLIKCQAQGYERIVVTTLFRFPGQTPYIVNQLSRIGGAEILLSIAPFLTDSHHMQ